MSLSDFSVKVKLTEVKVTEADRWAKELAQVEIYTISSHTSQGGTNGIKIGGHR